MGYELIKLATVSESLLKSLVLHLVALLPHSGHSLTYFVIRKRTQIFWSVTIIEICPLCCINSYDITCRAQIKMYFRFMYINMLPKILLYGACPVLIPRGALVSVSPILIGKGPWVLLVKLISWLEYWLCLACPRAMLTVLLFGSRQGLLKITKVKWFATMSHEFNYEQAR